MARIPPASLPIALTTIPTGSAVPLSMIPDFDERLQRLLHASVARIVSRAAPLRPRLLLLTGSAACGEASAVPRGARFLPLSDLDLLLMTERPAPGEWRSGLASGLNRELSGLLEELGLERNPIDVGLFPLLFFYRTPLTLELAEAVSQGIILWGDPACLQPRRGELPRAFEALRLLTNRVRETLHREVHSGGGFTSPRGPSWNAEPADEDWREAHRWAKLGLDGAKAWLAARGRLEPSLRERCTAIRDFAGATPSWLPVIEAWTVWRLAPSWPPPAIDPAALSALGREVLGAVARDVGLPETLPVTAGAWRKLLEREGGGTRDRFRAWRRFASLRPSRISRSRALWFALRWAIDAWPASLATLSLALVWIQAAGAAGSGDDLAVSDEGRRLREHLITEIPGCRDLPADRWDESWERALRAWAQWAVP
ncbi:MAG: hypothetical protein V1774_11505 [Candidatus Eisenbacteria bacterium]